MFTIKLIILKRFHVFTVSFRHSEFDAAKALAVVRAVEGVFVGVFCFVRNLVEVHFGVVLVIVTVLFVTFASIFSIQHICSKITITITICQRNNSLANFITKLLISNQVEARIRTNFSKF